ncbi:MULTISPECIES: SDR family NAD(P)-dependent oxidoreductase [unclassified Nonomuraea]|uniref:SDR family NAD(P)-dependent oxidoreductase n=1 Tax=unclassified Nonomuraea TaxID=2593643 RepID=UPI0033DB083B
MLERHLAVFHPRPGMPIRPPIPALPPGTLVLTDTPCLAEQISAMPEATQTTVVCTDRSARTGQIITHATEDTFVGIPENALARVCAITSLHDAPWPRSVPERLLTLQELLFLAARRMATITAPAGRSLAVLVLDPLLRGVPHPHSALLTGFVKCATWELTGHETYAVVTDAPMDQAFGQLEVESTYQRGLPVAHYRHGRRWEERLVPAPLTAASGAPVLTDDSVVVAAGGARGITATALLGLLGTARPTLWLLGSTPATDLTRSTTLPEGVDRASYIRESLRRSPGSHPAEHGKEYERLRRIAEMRRMLKAMRARCGAANVHYLTCDVTDPAAVDAAAAQVYGAHSRVDLLVNAAGIGGARALAGKSLDVFRRVRGVKIDGYRHLKSAFCSPPPELWCSFSSIAGAIGLTGESDYGPANDLLNLAARYESTHFGCRELAICWTMWGESGLGPRSGFTEYTRSTGRLSLLSDLEGQRLFGDELRADRGPQHAVIVHLGLAEHHTIRTQFPRLPADGNAYLTMPVEGNGTLVSWKLDLRGHDYLRGHRRRGRCILPGALAIELAAQAASWLTGGAPLLVVRDAWFRAPIALAPERSEYHLLASYADGVVRAEIRSRPAPALRSSLHFQADIVTDLPWVPHAADSAVPVLTTAIEALDSISGHGDPTSADTEFARPFDGLRDVRYAADGVRATWRAELPERQQQHFSLMRLPWLLLDAVLQAAGTTPGSSRRPTPHRILRIEPTAQLNDLQVLSRHPAGVPVAATHGGIQAIATTPQGEVIIRIDGLELAP